MTANTMIRQHLRENQACTYSRKQAQGCLQGGLFLMLSCGENSIPQQYNGQIVGQSFKGILCGNKRNELQLHIQHR